MMNYRKYKMLGALVLSLFAANVSAQVDEFPRTPSGKPDFSGIWQAMTKAHYDIEPHAAAYGPHPGQMGALSAIPGSQGIVEGGRIPYTEPARRQRDENQIDAIDKDPLTKCYMPGVPRANYLPFPFQIVQSTDVILIAYEFAESNRYCTWISQRSGRRWMLGWGTRMPSGMEIRWWSE